MGTPDAEIQLAGGVANAGAVVRIGDTVRRPLPSNHTTVHALFRHLRGAGFDGVPEPLGIDEFGREVLRYIPGDVPVPPYPTWSLTDDALMSVARLQRRFHDAVGGFVPPRDAEWSDELEDPLGGPVICHNDICPENVVFRGGEAIALLDFDYAAPGSEAWDLSCTIRMWAPLGDPAFMDPERAGLAHLERLRLFADAYGLPDADRPALVEGICTHLGFVQRHVEAGEIAFIEMWERGGGQERYDANVRWLDDHRGAMLAALR
jgi:aminoglycoside phosphotransferase (APT) family kinase protein